MQHVRHVAGFSLQFFALLYAKTVLFVDNNQAEFMHINLFADEGMRANNQPDFACCNSFLGLFFVCGAANLGCRRLSAGVANRLKPGSGVWGKPPKRRLQARLPTPLFGMVTGI